MLRCVRSSYLWPLERRAMKITFSFQGGCLDGQTITGDTDMRVCDSSARRYVFLTDCGRVGKRFREFPPERSDEIRRVLDTQTSSMDDLDAILQKVMGEIDPNNPPSCQELRRRMDDALREFGVDMTDYLRKSQEEMEQTNRRLESIKSEVYAVISRDDGTDEIRIEVKYIGEDTAETMYDL